LPRNREETSTPTFQRWRGRSVVDDGQVEPAEAVGVGRMSIATIFPLVIVKLMTHIGLPSAVLTPAAPFTRTRCEE
jgi:hypothetical protein